MTFGRFLKYSKPFTKRHVTMKAILVPWIAAALWACAGALAGDFTWRCTHGQVTGSVLLSPTNPPKIQSLVLDRKEP